MCRPFSRRASTTSSATPLRDRSSPSGLTVLEGDRRLFAATLLLRRRALDRAALGRLLWNYPAMTHRVTAGIYAQAARLRLKGAPFFSHPTDRGAPGAGGTTCPAPSAPVPIRTGP